MLAFAPFQGFIRGMSFEQGQAVMKHYVGDIKAWEVWRLTQNEPTRDADESVAIGTNLVVMLRYQDRPE